MNNIFKIPAFQRRKAIPKQLKDLELLPLNEQFSKLTISIVGDDDLRPALTGNFFDMEKKKIVSTDAHKMTALNMPNETFDFIAEKYNEKLKIEPKGLIFHTLSQIQKDYNNVVKKAGNNPITISFEKFVQLQEIQDGRYPNYEAVFPKDFTNEINVDYQKLYWYAKVLLDAKVIDDATKINTSNANEYQNKKIEYLKDSYVSFLPYTKQIILTYTLDGKQEYIGFNARLVCEILKFAMDFNGKTFGKVGISGNSRGMVVELENGLNVINDSVGLLMPIFLQSGQFDNTIGDSDFNNNVAMYYDLDTNSIISDNKNYPIDTMVGFYPNKAGLSIPNIRVKEEVSKVENSSADLIDKKIRGLMIALKLAKAENKANIEKKIKGLEIAKRMKKDDLPFAKGGMVEYFDYKGVEIMYEPTYDEYFANDLVFTTLEKAKKYIDSAEEKTRTYIPNLNRRGAMAKGGVLDNNTFVNVLFDYGFSETRGHYSIRNFKNMSNGYFAFVDMKNKNVEVFKDAIKGTNYSGFSIRELIDFLNKNGFIKQNKFANGGSVDEDISWDIFIRDEYDNETFEINVRGYFENEEDAIKQAIKDYDIYIDESDYDKMYWNGNEITIYGAKKNYKKGGKIERVSINVLNELYNLRDEGVTQVQLNGFSESIGYVIDLRLDDTEIKKVGNNAYITLYENGGSIDEIYAKGGEMSFSASEQENWSKKKSFMYDSYVSHSNDLVDLKEYLKKAKNRKDTDEVKILNIKKRNLEYSINYIKDKFINYENGGSVDGGDYYIFNGYDHYNNYPLYQVVGRNNDYVGEYHENIQDAKKELKDLKSNEYAKGGGVIWDKDSDSIRTELGEFKVRITPQMQKGYYDVYVSANKKEIGKKYDVYGIDNAKDIALEIISNSNKFAKGGEIKINDNITIKGNKVMANGTDGLYNAGTINEWFEDTKKEVQSILNDKDENGEILYKRIAESDNFIYYTLDFEDFNNAKYKISDVLDYYAVHKASGRGGDWEIWNGLSFMPLQDEFKYGKLNYQHPSLKRLMKQDSYYKNQVSYYKNNEKFNNGGIIDLFEDYENIPAEVQMILDEYSESFEDGDYIGMSKAQNELEQIGYTFDFYVDGDAYGLRPMNVKLSQLQGYEDEDEE